MFWLALTYTHVIPTLSESKTQLKTILFRQAFSQTSADHSCDNRLCICLRVYYVREWCGEAHLQKDLRSVRAIHYY